MLNRLITLICLALPTAASAADLAGHWTYRAGDVRMFAFDIVRTPAGLTATWDRPENWELDSETVTNVKGPVVRRTAGLATQHGDATEFAFADPRPNATPDVIAFRQTDADHVAMTFVRFPWQFALTREAAAVTLGPWDAEKTYATVDARPTNAAMTAIFTADQAARVGPNIDWSVVGPQDAARLKQTQALLAAGQLQSGVDFEHASFVFQHGDKPEDYLQAHLLAMIAVARGRTRAIWIAAATLDRYLQNIKQPQVLGTQFDGMPGGKFTQEPYARALVSDAERAALHVPPLAEQEEQRRQYEKDFAAANAAQPRK